MTHTSVLHPQARALLDLMVQRQIPPVHTQTPPEARRAYLERRHYAQPAPQDVALVQDLAVQAAALMPEAPDLPSLKLRHYRPLASRHGERLPALVYLHGGGWTIGDLDTHDTLCRELANLASCAVVSVDYRLGPEHRFPAAVHDAVAALRWVQAHADELHIDATRLAVGGDSAGGNLAAVVALHERQARADLAAALKLQLLIYPATDLSCSSDSHRSNAQGYLLTADAIRWYVNHYLGEEPARTTALQDWRASPLLHPDLSGLPPALVLTAGFDPLRDEGLAYARRLSDAGVPCSHLCFERQIHGFIVMGRVLEEANTAVALCAAELRRALHGA